MKQFQLKSIVTRLIGLMVAFFIVASLEGRAQTTHSVSSTDEWNSAVSSLQANDIIQLTADVTMGNVPDKACIITSDDGTKTLTYSSNLEMIAPLTFKSIKLNMSCIYANGYALVFEEGVDCVGTYSINNGQTTLTGLRNIWGGSETGTVASTSVVLKSGTFGWVYAGGNEGAVNGDTRMELSGSVKINGSIFGGGDAISATCGSTHVEISGGTYGYINGGGYNGSVTGECYLKISGNPTIEGNVFGGCNQKGTTAGSTHVEISGGTFQNSDNNGLGSIFGAGWAGSVSGCSSIRITGGTMGHVFGGSYSGTCGSTDVTISSGSIANIYGGGQGNRVDDNSGALVSCTGGDVTGLCKLSITGTTQVSGSIYGGGLNRSAHIGATDVFVDLSSGICGGILSGTGLSGNVKGDVKLVVAGGTFSAILGGGSSLPFFEGNVEGHIEILIRDIIVGNVSLVNGSGQLKGSGNITIEGGNVRFNNSVNIKGDNANRSNCTLTFNNCGSERTPYELLATVRDFSSMKLDNSYITPSQSNVNSSFAFDQLDKPFIIEGGKGLIGNFSISLSQPQLNDEVVRTDYLPAGSSFNYGGTYPLYKAGDGYRLGQLHTSSIATIQKISVMHVTNGNLAVVWNDGNRDIELKDGDQVPENELLKLSVVPASGYRLKAGSLKVYKTGDESTTVTLSGTSFNVPDYAVTASASFEQIPFIPDPVPPVYYTVTLPRVEGVTTDPIAGNYEVEAWDSFRFYLTLDKEYDLSKPVVTTDRGETIQPRTSDGAYIIKYVRQPIVIKIDGVMKNPDPVANETVETNGIKIYAANGYLHIQTPQPEQIHIFTPDGRLLKAFRTSGDEERIALPKGIYLIRTANQGVKVVL